MDIKTSSRSREDAYYALYNFLKEGAFLSKASLDPFARALSYGTCQYLLILDKFIKDVRPKKLKERVLLYLSLYERYFMKTPAYASQNEWITVGKKFAHPTFVKFLNHFLRNIPEKIEYKEEEAYPPFLKGRFPISVYEAMNKPAHLFVRDRLEKTFLEVDALDPYLDSDRYYVQNPTPFRLIEEIAKSIDSPKTILDLCANPGGKTIALHEFFPNAKFFTNDVKESKEMKENFERLNIEAINTQGDALYYPEDQIFDLVILDAPCSNSGVLNKRPEARHRITKESIEELHVLQIKLLEKALKLGKKVAYLTCSILEEENEMPYHSKLKKVVYPDHAGLDGGFLALYDSSSLNKIVK